MPSAGRRISIRFSNQARRLCFDLIPAIELDSHVLGPHAVCMDGLELKQLVLYATMSWPAALIDALHHT